MIRRFSFSLIFLFILFVCFSHTSTTHAFTISKSNVVNNLGLVGYWTFDGKDVVSGVIKDKSGQGNDGNTLNIATSTFYTAGKTGQAGNFDGVDDYVSMSSNVGTISSGTFTISAFIKLDHAPGNVGAIVGGAASSYPSLGISSAKKPAILKQGVSTVGLGATTLNLHQWYHLSGSYDGTTWKIYVNGVLDASGSNPVTFSTQNTRIGFYTFSSFQEYFPGIIDDVRIYNRTLSASEISAIYQSGSSKQNASQNGNVKSGLVGLWSFDAKDIVNGVIKDRSGNGNDGNALNIATSSFYTTGKLGQGLSFDGVDDQILIPSSLGISGYPFTISSWVKTNSASSLHIIGGFFDSTSSSIYKAMGINSSNFSVWTGNASVGSSGVNINDGKWHFVTTVFDSDTSKRMFVDNILADTYTTSSVYNASINRFCIGRACDSTPSSPFSGIIDDVRVYNRALTTSEITSLYRSGTPVFNASQNTTLTTGLVGLWSFDGRDVVNGVIKDRSGSGNDGNAIGIATSSFYTTGKVGQGVRFDGVNDKVTTSLSISTYPASECVWVYPFPASRTTSAIFFSLPFMMYSINNAGAYYIQIYNNRSTVSTPTGSLVINKWQHVCATIAPDNTTNIYINGVLKKTGDIGNLVAGGSFSINDGTFVGMMDDVHVYNRELSAAEVNQLYTMGK